MDIRIAAIGTANPPCRVAQSRIAELIGHHYADVLSPRSMAVLQQVLAHPSIEARYASFDNELQMLSLKDEDPDARIERFTKWSVELSARAVEQALTSAGLGVNDIGGLIVNTCTGYICPGIATYLVERLRLPSSLQVHDLVGSGCGGAVPNMQLGSQILMSDPRRPVVSVSVEVCSATYEMDNDMSLLISNGIFGDGAAAAVLASDGDGPLVGPFANLYDPRFREDVRFVYKHGRLHNKISVRLPKTVRRAVAPMIREYLACQGLTVADVKHWAIHPGGDKILSELQEELGLSDEQMAYSTAVLREYGNMSSPSVLFVLKRMLESGAVKKGEHVLVTAFGAGMSAYVTLLEM